MAIQRILTASGCWKHLGKTMALVVIPNVPGKSSLRSRTNHASSVKASLFLAGGVGESHQPVKLALRLSRFESYARNKHPNPTCARNGRWSSMRPADYGSWLS